MITILIFIIVTLAVILGTQIAVNSDLRAQRDLYKEQLQGKCLESIPVIGTKVVTEDDVLHAKYNDLPRPEEVFSPKAPQGNTERNNFSYEYK